MRRFRADGEGGTGRAGRSFRVAGVGLGGLVALGLGFALAFGAFSVTAPDLGGIEDLPLPGGADLGSHPYTVHAELADVLSLVPQSAVKVNDVAVGRVTDIRLGGSDWTARVTMKINGKVRLPADTSARVEQSSLLGEKYIQLIAPGSPAGKAGGAGAGKPAGGGRLADGVTIPLARTSRDTEVEEVFGALSLLLNGGGVNQLKTITKELDAALGGREPQVRSMLKRVNKLVTTLDDHRGDITDALDGVNKLSATLATRKKDVGTVLTGLSPGLKTLEEQRGSLLTMLRSLDRLSTVAVSTIHQGKADMVADLKALAPTLRSLADAGKDLPDSLQVLVTYPFTDEVLRGVKGDYLNTYLDVVAVPGTQVIPPLVPTPSGSAPPTPSPTAKSAPRKTGKTGRTQSAPRETGKQSGGGDAPLPLPSVPASGGETP